VHHTRFQIVFYGAGQRQHWQWGRCLGGALTTPPEHLRTVFHHAHVVFLHILHEVPHSVELAQRELVMVFVVPLSVQASNAPTGGSEQEAIVVVEVVVVVVVASSWPSHSRGKRASKQSISTARRTRTRT
jgi:hypothetical protein